MPLAHQGCPGEETATAYAIPILERVLQRYPPSVPRPLEGSGKRYLELQTLVLTRTRDMAATVTVSGGGGAEREIESAKGRDESTPKTLEGGQMISVV